MRYSGLALSFGLLMIILAGLGFLGGQALDRRLGTSPLFAILGVLAGIGLAFYDLLREVSLADRLEKRRRQGRGRDGRKGDGRRRYGQEGDGRQRSGRERDGLKGGQEEKG